MKYYRVRSERSDWFSNYHTRPGELFTEKERNSKVRYITEENADCRWKKVRDCTVN